MKYSKLVNKYDNIYNYKWLEFILNILDKYKCNIDIIEFFKNDNLTLSLFNKMKFIKIKEPNNSYLSINIEYQKKIYKTPFILNPEYEIEFYAIFNPNFGKKYLIKFLDSINKTQFLKLFNANILNSNYEEVLLFEIINSIHFTPEIILRYLSKFLDKPIEKLNKDIRFYTNFVGINFFWNTYSKKKFTDVEKYIKWPWNWENILKFSYIDTDFINKYKDFIVNQIYLEYLELNRNFKKETALDIFNLNICYNKNIDWWYKENIIDKGFQYLNTRVNKILLNIDIGIPDNILRDIVYNKNNRYSEIIYHIFKNQFLLYRYFPKDIVDYIFENYRQFILPVQLNYNQILKNKNNISKLLKCSCLNLTHNLFYCKYENISIDTIYNFNLKKRKDYLELDKMDLHGNKSFGWYQFEKYKNINCIDQKKNTIIDIDLDSYSDYYYKKINFENINCKNEYFSDKLNLEYNASKIQKWWKYKIYNPYTKLGQKFISGQIEWAFKE